jgi:shikimate kinase
MRLFLCGFMGAGKTKVGKLVAAKVGWPFVDLDQEIERREGKKVAEIFAEEGESRFRQLETAALAATAELENGVIALGGGAFAELENREIVGRLGRSLWLDVEFPLILRRMTPEHRQKRPLFRDESAARDLYERRLASYRFADLHLRIESEAPAEEVAARIVSTLQEGSSALSRPL